EDHLRNVKSSLNKKSVVDSKATSSVIIFMSNVNSDLKCASCDGCLFSDNHDACVVAYIKFVNASIKSKYVKTPVKRKVWKPTGRTFTLVGNVCPLTRIAIPTIVPPREPIPIVNSIDKPVVTLVVQIVLWYLDSDCSKHMTRDRSQLVNFVQKFLGTVKFGNDHVAKIMGYGDYQIGNVTISQMELIYLLFSEKQSVYSVSTRHDGVLTNMSFVQGIQDQVLALVSSLINHLARQGLVRGLPKLKFEKDHLCSACAMGKSTKKTHKPKSEDTNQGKLYLLHMDLCGPMRVESVNGKKYILFIVDDYSRFTWVKLLRSKDETPDFTIKFLKMIQHNGVVERRNRTLIEAARTMLIYAQAPLFLWAEAVATTCFTQNRSIIRLRHGKTPYELLHSKLPDLSFSMCFVPTIIRQMIVRIWFRTRGLVQTSSPSTSYVPPLRNDWDLLFQSMFDELLNPSPSVVNQAPEVIAPIAAVIPPVHADLTRSPSSITEELNEFERLEVWELVPRPDQVMVITLKWIYKVKLDELGGILKNKARLVARGYRQEEGIDFEESFAP
nr:hypothetical protein [Tanacetum cinerariifolium]